MTRKFSNPLWFSFIFALAIVLTPQAFAAEVIVDDFSDGGLVEVIDSFDTCEYDMRLASVLGGIRGIFVCRDSGSGQSTGQANPTPSEFLFRLNEAGGSAGTTYDNDGALLGGLDITDSGNNDGIILQILSSDSQVTGFIHASDTSGNFGIHQFIIPATISPTTVSIPLLLVTDTNSAGPVNFASLGFLGVSFEGEQLGASDSDFILGSISTDALQASADLSISKSDNIDPIIAGNQLLYTVTVNNAGPDDATGVVVTDTLPAGVTFVSSTPPICVDSGGILTCTIGTIAASDFEQVFIEVTVNPGTTGDNMNTVVVFSNTMD